MDRDFYLNEISRAAYFEKDWFDHVIASGMARPSRFAFAPFPLDLLYSFYHEKFAERVVAGFDGPPRNLLEIGSSTGRTFFELARRFPSLETATLVEPSSNLLETFKKIFVSNEAGRAFFPVIKGLGQTAEVALAVGAIRKSCAHVELTLIPSPFERVAEDHGTFDLVICSNVVDQCDFPITLVERLRQSAAPNGLVAISTTYQWQTKYKGLPAKPIRHLDELFPEPWRLIDEANIPFQLRVNERHWMTFLSHVCLFRRR